MVVPPPRDKHCIAEEVPKGWGLIVVSLLLGEAILLLESTSEVLSLPSSMEGKEMPSSSLVRAELGNGSASKSVREERGL